MANITGLGGAFLRANDPETLYAWYEQHLQLKRKNGCFCFPAAQQRAQAVVSFFPRPSKYFPTSQAAMLNLQVDDLDAVLDRLIAEGVSVDPKREHYDFGNFGWFTDPEGNRVELWQPLERPSE
jgi:predicted enzyme related to lactoylglutathione lyase